MQVNTIEEHMEKAPYPAYTPMIMKIQSTLDILYRSSYDSWGQMVLRKDNRYTS